jgi:predicted pyridoxine 5'-phosphate oxidase superfamily flavin-nucleotide-binding protein
MELLEPEAYKHRPERMIVLDVEAWDWNCPQHITPRYTEEEIAAMFAQQQDITATLREEIRALKAKLNNVAGKTGLD